MKILLETYGPDWGRRVSLDTWRGVHVSRWTRHAGVRVVESRHVALADCLLAVSPGFPSVTDRVIAGALLCRGGATEREIVVPGARPKDYFGVGWNAPLGENDPCDT